MMARQYLVLTLTLALALLLGLLPLPEPIDMLRPAWVLLVLTAWAYRGHDVDLLVPAFLSGLLMDALYDTALGAHALALTLAVALTLRIRVLMRSLMLWQAMLLMIPVVALYTLLLHWGGGLGGQGLPLYVRLWPALATVLLWPMVVLLQRAPRNESGGSQV